MSLSYLLMPVWEFCFVFQLKGILGDRIEALSTSQICEFTSRNLMRDKKLSGKMQWRNSPFFSQQNHNQGSTYDITFSYGGIPKSNPDRIRGVQS